MLSSVALSKIERFFHASQTLTSFFFKEEDFFFKEEDTCIKEETQPTSGPEAEAR